MPGICYSAQKKSHLLPGVLTGGFTTNGAKTYATIAQTHPGTIDPMYHIISTAMPIWGLSNDPVIPSGKRYGHPSALSRAAWLSLYEEVATKL